MPVIRVMSFNIFLTELQEDEIESFSDVWANRSDFNVRTIKRYRPDVIGFQELDQGHLATYGEQLSDYSHAIAGAHARNISNAIFWKTERWQPRDAGVFWLSRTPDVPGSDWGVEYPLGVTWVLLEETGTEARILFANTQFEDGPWGEESRTESSKLMLQRSPQLPGASPIILTGDFNCNPWSAA